MHVKYVNQDLIDSLFLLLLHQLLDGLMIAILTADPKAKLGRYSSIFFS